MPKLPYQICSQTVMDTSDSRIVFDEHGVCDHATDFLKNTKELWDGNLANPERLTCIIDDIKHHGCRSPYDCIIGLSGGVDSSYMLHVAVKEFGLRPLVFHVDGGWNSELAVNNIQSLVDRLGLDLYTEVINWEEMRDFQLAWFKSGVPHLDLAQDHAFVATLYKFADKHKIKYILNGGNISTECVRNPLEYYYYGTDMLHIRDIIRRYGSVKMKTYPFSSVFRHKIYLRYVRRLKVVRPLNFMPYVKSDAMRLLEQEYGWRPYPQKHFESRFTKFYESYWLPERFGFDPRRVQFSSLILTGQMSRDEALNKLDRPPCDPSTIAQEFEFIATKLRITTDELNHYFTMPKKFYWDYRNQKHIFDLGARVLKGFGLEAAIKR
jgi:N-acetyl sugar amidotransferase